MADLSKLKKRTTLGEPPPFEEASTNLKAPEVAPVAHEPQRGRAVRRIDGRYLRRTGRTVQFATRVSEEFDTRFRRIAQRDGLRFGELLERALASYETLKITSS